MTSWWRHTNGPFDSNGPFSGNWPFNLNGPFGSSLPLTISNSYAPPDGFIEPIEGGPSLEVPLTMVLCPSGVSEVWLCSALFQKALFQFLLFRTSDFPKRSVSLATLLRLLPRLNLFALGHLQDSFPTAGQPRILKRSLQCDIFRPLKC